jgi:hypothetical protein
VCTPGGGVAGIRRPGVPFRHAIEVAPDPRIFAFGRSVDLGPPETLGRQAGQAVQSKALISRREPHSAAPRPDRKSA